MLSQVAPLRVGGDDVRIVQVGGDAPLALVAGPCSIEGEERTLRIAAGLAAICTGLDVPLVFKASFDKANRTSLSAWRGPGLDEGLRILERVRSELGLPVTTDVHIPAQAPEVAGVVDLLQVPAFLCRQTDLLVACAETGRPVNVKKGQFMAPWDMGPAVAKLVGSGAMGVMVTERGTSFGYNNLVVDMRSLAEIRGLGVPVCFDATHAVQLPGGRGGSSGGERKHVPFLARAAAGVGIDALFLEVHDEPGVARSDTDTQLPLAELGALLEAVLAVDAAVR